MMQRLKHLTAETLERYRARTLLHDEQLAARAHAFSCAECRQRLGEVTEIAPSLASLRDSFAPMFDEEPAHLTYEQLAAYVDEQLDAVEREIVESHLLICTDCDADARDLYLYQTIIEQTPLHANATEQASPETSSRRWLTFDWFPSFRPLVPTAAMAALLTLAVIGLWAAYGTREQKPGVRARVENGQTGESGAPTVATTTTTNTPTSSLPQATAVGANPSSTQPSQPVAAVPRETASRNNNNDAPSRPRHRPAAAPTIASTTVILIDGERRVTFDGAGNPGGLEGLPADVQRAVRRTIINGNVETPAALDSLRGNTGILMGDSADVNAGDSGSSNNSSSGGVPFALVAPVGKIVRVNQPEFNWRPLNGANGYTVAIVDARFNVVEQSERLTTNKWTPSKPLPRGAIYSWQVTALRDGVEIVSPVAPAPQAKFKVLEQDLADDLARVEAEHVDSPLVRGVLYARAGLIDEARREFQSLAKANPRSPVAQRLLKSVRRK